MRISRIALVLVTLSIMVGIGPFSSQNAWACGPSSGCSANHESHGGGHAKKGTTVTYTCPMHPEVTSDRPGKCPKCGMLLETKAAKQTVYTCPMHPEISANEPGKCPKCGMTLEKKSENVTYEYVCPMHSSVVSDKPGTCPTCGMFLEARPKGAASGADSSSVHAH